MTTSLILSLTAICISSFVIYANYKNGKYDFILKRFKMKKKEVKQNDKIINSQMLGGSLSTMMSNNMSEKRGPILGNINDITPSKEAIKTQGRITPDGSRMLYTLDEWNDNKKEELKKTLDELRGYTLNLIKCPNCGAELYDESQEPRYSIYPNVSSVTINQSLPTLRQIGIFCRLCDFEGKRYD